MFKHPPFIQAYRLLLGIWPPISIHLLVIQKSFFIAVSSCRFECVFDKGIPKAPKEILEQGYAEAEEYLVGYSLDRRPSYYMVRHALKIHRKDFGSYEIISDKDMFFFLFTDPETRKKGFGRGSYVHWRQTLYD